MTLNVLWLLHLPPPVHGSSVVGGLIRDSELINRTFHCRYVNLLASRKLGESGRLNLYKLFGFFVLGLRLVRELLRKKPDVCYFALTTSGMAFFRDAILIAMLKLYRVRTVYHLHNKGISSKQKWLVYRLAYKFVFHNARVILLSSHLYSDIQAFVPPGFVFYCPNGIPDEHGGARCALREEEAYLDSTVHILFLSNLIESKGVGVLLEACAVLKRNGNKFTCDFVGAEGDISAAAFQEELLRLNLTDIVRYRGRRYGAEKNAAFLAADIFSLPTFYDCLPLVLIEAMQYSLPVVSCPEGGIPDLVVDGETGFLVPQRDVAVLAERLAALISSPELRHNMGSGARCKYESTFTLAAFENRLVDILGIVSRVRV